MNEDIVRVLRVVEYEGPRSWVEATVAKSIHGEKDVSQFYHEKEDFRSGHDRDRRTRKIIRAATIGEFPTILQRASDAEKG